MDWFQPNKPLANTSGFSKTHLAVRCKVLIIFGGLPGTGKTTLAKLVATQLEAVYLRADTIEHAMRNNGWSDGQIGGLGYVIAYNVAEENLKMGRIVVADTVNPLSLTREAWRGVALSAGTRYLEIEVICSDPIEHQRRVESRIADINGFRLPTWLDVVNREYEEWDGLRLRIDTAKRTPAESLEIILEHSAGRESYL